MSKKRDQKSEDDQAWEKRPNRGSWLDKILAGDEDD